MDKEWPHIAQAVVLSVTDLLDPVVMDLHAVVQVVARAAHLFTRGVLMVTSATGNAKQGSHIVLGSPRIETNTMAPEYLTREITGQETRKEDTIGEEIFLVTVHTLTWYGTDLLEDWLETGTTSLIGLLPKMAIFPSLKWMYFKEVILATKTLL